MKNTLILLTRVATVIFLSLLLAFSSMGCASKKSGDASLDTSDVTASEQTDYDSEPSKPNLMWGDTPLGDISSNEPSSLKPNSSSSEAASSKDENKSAEPIVTVATQVGNNVCVVAGICSKKTQKINISGEGVTALSVTPYAGKDNYYFAAQVEYTKSTNLKVTATEKGKKTSEVSVAYVNNSFMPQNYMERNEYSPVFGKNSRMHFYSALLSYSQNTEKFDSNMRNIGKNSIKNIVSEADKAGAETIFLIIPSSADIYPETVPNSVKKASGERLYEAFTKIAESYGAKVIYPIDTMKKHRNDGVGYQLYQYTDSHWSTYGSYWGTYDMLNYISKKFPSAKPRTLKQMEFYTYEMHAGDAFFNFPRDIGFENFYGDGTTNVTQMKELTTLYKLKMPTNTLKKVYNSYNGLYLTEDNANADTVVNKNGKGLPSAVIMRDSFGKISYDMLNDRFSTVYWGEFDNYNLPTDIISKKKPDYVIYMYSERNLLKILLNNSDANLLSLK